MRTIREPRPSVQAWIHILKIYTLVARCAEKELKSRGLTLPRFDVIAQLVARKEGCRQEDLCDKLLVTKGHMSGLLDRMVKEGLISRETDPTNRRCNRVGLTARGRKAFQEMIPRRDSCLDRMFSSLTRQEQVELTDILCKLLRSLKEREGYMPNSMGGDRNGT